jgi:hypothetical protein
VPRHAVIRDLQATLNPSTTINRIFDGMIDVMKSSHCSVVIKAGRRGPGLAQVRPPATKLSPTLSIIISSHHSAISANSLIQHTRSESQKKGKLANR